MGTYNLAPGYWAYKYTSGIGSWETYTGSRNIISTNAPTLFRVDLPDSVNISKVKVTFEASKRVTSDYATVTMEVSVTNYSGYVEGQTSRVLNALVTDWDYTSEAVSIFSGVDYDSLETDCFYVALIASPGTYVNGANVRNILVEVTYRDPPPTPQPSVTITGPIAGVFEAGTSLSYSWTVSNGTQTSAVIQESSDGSNWTDKYTISGSTTTKQTSASGVGFHYWRVVVSFSDGTQKTSGNGYYSVTEPYVPPTPDEPPSISNISTSPEQPDGLPSTFSSVYIANISKCKVQAAVSAGTNPIREVYFSYPGVNKVSMSYSSSGYVGTTPLALSATTTITVTAVDTAGYYTSDTVNIPVTPYADPTLTINTLYRCNAQGAEDNAGQYYKIKVTAGYSSVSNKNSIASGYPKAGVKNGNVYTIASGTTYIKGPELLNEDLVYVIQIAVKDLVGHETTVERSLSGKLRDVVFKRDEYHKTAHIGVGMTPDGNARTTVQLPPNGTIIIGGQDLISWLQETLGESFPGWGS